MDVGLVIDPDIVTGVLIPGNDDTPIKLVGVLTPLIDIGVDNGKLVGTYDGVDIEPVGVTPEILAEFTGPGPPLGSIVLEEEFVGPETILAAMAPGAAIVPVTLESMVQFVPS